MPGRGGRIGGGSRGGGFRAPRVSSGGSRGARVNIGSRAPRVTSSVPSSSAPTSRPIHHYRPWLRNRLPGTGGGGVSIVLLVGLIVLGVCVCAALVIALQAFGFGA